jgi:hypothetical protein
MRGATRMEDLRCAQYIDANGTLIGRPGTPRQKDVDEASVANATAKLLTAFGDPLMSVD